jgi:hypothetical protein
LEAFGEAARDGTAARFSNASHTGMFLRSDGGKVSRKATAAGWCRWVKGPAAARAGVTGRSDDPRVDPAIGVPKSAAPGAD